MALSNEGSEHNMTTLIIIWNDGSKEEHTYASLKEAMEAERGFHVAFGEQVWTAVR